jgi:hypothetical protein
MKKSLLFIFLFAFHCLPSLAQHNDSLKVIGIHPAVGKMITRDEKIKYHLFPEYKDSIFESAQIFSLNDSTFLVSIKTINGIEVRNYISTSQLDKIYYRIDELQKGKQVPEEEYVMTKEEKKEARKGRARDASLDFLVDFFAQMTIITLEALLTFALTN